MGTALPDVDTQSWQEYQAQQFQDQAQQDMDSHVLGHAFNQDIANTEAWWKSLTSSPPQPEGSTATPDTGATPPLTGVTPDQTPPAGPEAASSLAEAQPPVDASQVGAGVPSAPASAPDLTQSFSADTTAGVAPPLTGIQGSDQASVPPSAAPVATQPSDYAVAQSAGPAAPLTGIQPATPPQPTPPTPQPLETATPGVTVPLTGIPPQAAPEQTPEGVAPPLTGVPPAPVQQQAPEQTPAGVAPPLTGILPSWPTNVAPEGSTVPTSDVAPGSLGPIDNSSHEAFYRSFAPYAAYASARTGIAPDLITAMAASESGWGNAKGNELFGIKALAGQKRTTQMTHEGEGGGTQMNQDFAAYDTPLDSVDAWVDLITSAYPNAMGAQNGAELARGLKTGKGGIQYMTAGEGEYAGLVGSLQGAVDKAVPPDAYTTSRAASTGGGYDIPTAADVASGRIPGGRPSQFGSPTIDKATAATICGPAAAIAFYRATGRDMTLDDAMQMASARGDWDAGTGMHGIGSEADLLKGMGVQAHVTSGVDWNQVQADVARGNPVILDSPGHYWVVDGYNPDTGQYHFGTSSSDLIAANHQEWFTPQAAAQLGMGDFRGALFIDNASPAGSVARDAGSASSSASSAGRSGAQQLYMDALDTSRDTASSGLDWLDQQRNNVGGTFSNAGSKANDLSQQLLQGGSDFANQFLNPTGLAPEGSTAATQTLPGPAGSDLITDTAGNVYQKVGSNYSDFGSSVNSGLTSANQFLDTASQPGIERQRQIESQIDLNNPLRDVPVVGGVTSELAKTGAAIGTGLEVGHDEYSALSQAKNQFIEEHNPLNYVGPSITTPTADIPGIGTVGGTIHPLGVLSSGAAEIGSDPLTWIGAPGLEELSSAALTRLGGESLNPVARWIADKAVVGAGYGGIQAGETPNITPSEAALDIATGSLTNLIGAGALRGAGAARGALGDVLSEAATRAPGEPATVFAHTGEGTPASDRLISSADSGGIPLSTRSPLIQDAAAEHGITVTPDMTPQDVIDRVRAARESAAPTPSAEPAPPQVGDGISFHDKSQVADMIGVVTHVDQNGNVMAKTELGDERIVRANNITAVTSRAADRPVSAPTGPAIPPETQARLAQIDNEISQWQSTGQQAPQELFDERSQLRQGIGAEHPQAVSRAAAEVRTNGSAGQPVIQQAVQEAATRPEVTNGYVRTGTPPEMINTQLEHDLRVVNNGAAELAHPRYNADGSPANEAARRIPLIEAGRAGAPAPPQTRPGFQGRPIELTDAEQIARLRPEAMHPDVRDAVVNAAREVGWANDERRGVIADSVAQRMAGDWANSTKLDDLIKEWKPGTAYNTEQLRALRAEQAQLGAEVAWLHEQAANLAELPPDMQRALVTRLLSTQDRLEAVTKIFEAGRAESGRGQRAFMGQTTAADMFRTAREAGHAEEANALDRRQAAQNRAERASRLADQVDGLDAEASRAEARRNGEARGRPQREPLPTELEPGHIEARPGRQATTSNLEARDRLFNNIADAYEQLQAYRAMGLDMKEEDFQALQRQREHNAAVRKQLLDAREDPQKLLDALRKELAGERKVFRSQRPSIEAYQQFKRPGGPLEQAPLGQHGPSPAEVLRAQARQALRDMNRANREAKSNWDQRMTARQKLLQQKGELMADLNKRGIPPDTIARASSAFNDMVKSGADPIEFAHWWQTFKADPAGWSDFPNALHYNSMISGVPTVERIGIGGSLSVLYNVLRDSAFTPQFGAAMKGTWLGLMKGLSLFAETLTHGQNIERILRDVEDKNYRVPLSNRIRMGMVNPSLARLGLGGKFGERLARGLELPGRTHSAINDLVESVAYYGDAYRRFAQESQMLGLGPQEEPAYIAKQAELMSIGKRMDVAKEARQYAETASLRGEMGWMTSALKQLGRVPYIGKIIMPFVRVAANMTARMIDFSPLGALGTGLDTFRTRGAYAGTRSFEDVRALPPDRFGNRLDKAVALRPFDQRLKDNVVGSALTAFALWQAFQDNVTGSGPADSAARQNLEAQGWQPWSLRILNHYVPYRMLSYGAAPFAAAGSIHDAVAYRKPNQGPLDVMADMGKRTAEFGLSESYLRDSSNAVMGLQDPTRYGSSFVTDLATSMIPYGSLLADIAESPIPFAGGGGVQRGPYTGNILEDALTKAASRTPFLVNAVPPRQDILGRDLPTASGGWAGFTPGNITNAGPSDLAIMTEAGRVMQPVRDQAFSHDEKWGVKLTPQEQADMNRSRGEYLQPQLEALSASPTFQALSDEQKQRVLQRVVSEAEKRASTEAFARAVADDRNRAQPSTFGGQPSIINPRSGMPAVAAQ